MELSQSIQNLAESKLLFSILFCLFVFNQTFLWARTDRNPSLKKHRWFVSNKNHKKSQLKLYCEKKKMENMKKFLNWSNMHTLESALPVSCVSIYRNITFLSFSISALVLLGSSWCIDVITFTNFTKHFISILCLLPVQDAFHVLCNITDWIPRLPFRLFPSLRGIPQYLPGVMKEAGGLEKKTDV